jgi:hypothetical protein
MVETVKAYGLLRLLKEDILIAPGMGRVRNGVAIGVGDLPPA